MKQSQMVALIGFILVAPTLDKEWGRVVGVAAILVGSLMGVLE